MAGLDLEPLLDWVPSNSCRTSISLVWGLNFCTWVRSISSRLRSPSHHTAKLTEFGWLPITSPL